jgi:hypothetical protein
LYITGNRKSVVKTPRKETSSRHVAELLKVPHICHCNKVIVEANTTKSRGGSFNAFTSDEEKKKSLEEPFIGARTDEFWESYRKRKSTVPRRRNVSLFSEFQHLGCSYKMVLNKFALQAQRNVKSRDIVMHNTPTGCRNSMDTGYR